MNAKNICVHLWLAVVPAFAAPELAVTPAHLEFVVGPGQGAPPPQSVAVTSSGDSLSFEVASAAGWVAVTPSGGRTPATVSVSVNPSGLPPGSHRATLGVFGTGAAKSPLAVTISLEIEGQSAVTIQVSPSFLTFNAQSGGYSSSAQSVGVTSTGGTVQFSATSGATWLSVSPSNGTTPASLVVSASAAGLSPGSYHGSIAMYAPGAANSPQSVSVSLNITENQAHAGNHRRR